MNNFQIVSSYTNKDSKLIFEYIAAYLLTDAGIQLQEGEWPRILPTVRQNPYNVVELVNVIRNLEI